MNGNKNILKFGALFCATVLISFLMTIWAKITGDCLDFLISEPIFSPIIKGVLFFMCFVICQNLIICTAEWMQKKGEADFDQIGFDRYISKIFCLLIVILIIIFLTLMYMVLFLDKFKMIIPERWIEAISNIAHFW